MRTHDVQFDERATGLPDVPGADSMYLGGPRITPRPRRYVSPLLLIPAGLVFRYSPHRQAYVLRLIGQSRGPVLRAERRRRAEPFDGPDLRGTGRRLNLLA